MLNALSNCILKIEHGIRHSNRPEDRILGEKFLAYLAPVLASSELSCVQIEQLNGFERLVGHSFLVDPRPFGTFYDDWKEYKDQCERMLCLGMTANERIYSLGLLDDFDKSSRNRDWSAMAEILHRAHFESKEIEGIIKSQKNNG